jgi:SNF2 family DNA or RNA helicase
MPRIFDNIDEALLTALRNTLQVSQRADFCVGYFNLRGWQAVDDLVQGWQPSEGQICRVLVGMQRPQHEDIRLLYKAQGESKLIDNADANKLKLQFAADLREQITLGIPTGADEAGLRRLATQLRAGQVVVKLFLPYPLHAKLYLLFRDDANNPVTGFVGSSNLTLSGLSKQGELNVDVLDHQATSTLSTWFNDRWSDRWALDLSQELAHIIETSWARPTAIPPHHIYLNIAYHLSTEARAGLSQFRLPARFEQELFEFQKSAVKIAARHLHRRGGVMIGDVVGLGKTMMATALARMFEDDLGFETLIICPKNLENMWNSYRTQYGLRGQVLPISKAIKDLPHLKRYKLVLIDESHNLRNREGRRYKAIADYIRESDAKVILLTATPYNKTKADLSSQLRLFIDEKANIGIRPEHFLRANQMTEGDFERKYQCRINSILAIEKSDVFDDWRELIRLYMVRRTRSFITQHYTEKDTDGRSYLLTSKGEKRYFPTRLPRNVHFASDASVASDKYAQLYSTAVVDTINQLHVPRYGLGLYKDLAAEKTANAAEKKLIENLGKAGHRLMGFCRTNLFKRLESSGFAFLQSIDRHVLRNQIYIYAIEQGLDLPIGVLDADVLDADTLDEDIESSKQNLDDLLDGVLEEAEFNESLQANTGTATISRAAAAYTLYSTQFKSKFKWISPRFFKPNLAQQLAADTQALNELMRAQGIWNAAKDAKLLALKELVTQTHGKEKLLIFTQFADTARYLGRELASAGVKNLEIATGSNADPYALACRFSPISNNQNNGQKISKADEIRVLICTDVLSEGQNLQDSRVVVNFDLPWAIIRLIQRAGRVDRIGQQAQEIICYSFMPADGVEALINLRSRIKQRLQENAEVVGTDEAFFEDEATRSAGDPEAQALRNLYTEQSGVLDDTDDEVDLASYAWQIWRQATADDPALARAVESLPPVVYSAKTADYAHAGQTAVKGTLVYVKSPEGNDHLAWIGVDGQPVTESQYTVLRAAECSASTAAQARADNHHELVAAGMALAVQHDKAQGGGLGRPSSPRRRSYDILRRYCDEQANTLFKDEALEHAVDDMYRNPLLESAADILNRLIRSGIHAEELANAVKSLREENRLTYTEQEAATRDPRVVCSLGLV